MADDPRTPVDKDDNPLQSLQDTSTVIGANADGSIDIFPADEFPARLAKDREQDEIAAYAQEQSEAGFPEEDEGEETDISDLDEI